MPHFRKRIITVNTAGSLTAAVRAHYGISQTGLALYLSVSRSLLSLADINRRQLPTEALNRLIPLVEAMPPPWGQGRAEPPPAPLPAAAPAPPLADLPAPEVLRRRQTICELELYSATRALTLIEHTTAQARRLLAILPALAATLPPVDTSAGARAHRQLSLLEAEARDRLGPGPAATRALLLARQAALNQEIAWLRAWLP